MATATEEYPLSNPKPLWSEQNPEDWWKASVACLRKLLKGSNVSAGEIKSVGLSGQMHGLVLLDNQGIVLRPCILWNDQRTGEQCESITRKLGLQQLLRLTGNPVLPGFTAPKIVWVRENEPRIYEKTSHVLLPKDYIRLRLTGEYTTDVSDASGTSLLDVRRRTWSKEMLVVLDLPAAWMPQLIESSQIAGRISRGGSEATGLKEGIPVVGVGGDQAA
ncbi:MAG: hypothetical protein HY562_01035 [Ignavibacteriales bacterium]|nr:hypothetical protein [Ignavibacteriales bacterium]